MLSEGLFTKPSPWCPHPELWSAFDSQSSERETTAFLVSLAQLIKPARALELGIGRGYTTRALAAALGVWGGRLTAIDLEVPIDLMLLVDIRVGDALLVPWPLELGLIYIDCDQQHRAAMARRAENHVARHGVIVIHDTAPHQRAADCAALDGAITFRTPRGLTLYQPRK